MDAADSGLEPRLSPPNEREKLADYIRRVIADHEEFRALSSAASFFGFDLSAPWWFRPGMIDDGVVQTFYEAMSRTWFDPTHDRGRALNHLWTGRAPRRLPLSLQQFPDMSGLLPDVATESDPKREDAQRVAVGAGKWRDERLAAFCFRLRSGEWEASGYLSGDSTRTMVPIASAWWADDAMECRWRDGELRPHGVADGRPAFLGIELMVHATEPTPRKFTNADVQRWFIERVKAYEAEARHPSQVADWEAARAHFPGIQRKIILSLRSEFVPERRRRQGRSKKSANPPK